MQYMYVIRFHDKSFRVVSPKQALSLKSALNAHVKCVSIDDDYIALASISRIESAKYLLAEMPEERFSIYGYQNINRELGRDMRLLPLTVEYLLSEEKKVRSNLSCLLELTGKETSEEREVLAKKHDVHIDTICQLSREDRNLAIEHCEQWLAYFEKKGLIQKKIASPLIHAK